MAGKGSVDMKQKLLTLFLLTYMGAALFAQTPRYPRGAIFDEAAYSRLPQKAPLATRSYEGLPRAFSLKAYAPLPGDQTEYGTCVAWASAYAARTISESFALGRKSQSETTQSVFSPVYVYRNIRPDDPECQQGAQIFSALDLMKERGAVKMLDVERTVDFPRVDISLYTDSRKYPIADYVTLFNKDDRYKPGLVTRIVKKSLSEGKPVIIGMNTPESFMEAKDLWQPVENPQRFYGGHAMCVVGYDDTRGGGAFEIINSWGRKWGNGGFMWIPYQAFVDYVMESYEMIENLAVYSDTVKFAGSVRLEITKNPGETVGQGAAAGQPRTAPLAFTGGGVYKTSEAFAEGTEFRFAAGSGESAYVYALAVSEERAGIFSPVHQLFPQSGESALLNYRDSTVIIPGENKSLVLDGSSGMEYLILLYAKEALNVRNITRRFESAKGTVNERLATATEGRLLSAGPAQDAPAGTAAFALESKDSKAIAALIVAIEHK
ncbi:hypothetical protein AGMMS50267_04090 [Spirochaetia bacterium]|nr:hypothetical protein AGMMS50267_04090 [Spirochaetia bacterium]